MARVRTLGVVALAVVMNLGADAFCPAQAPVAWVGASEAPLRGVACGLFKRRRSSSAGTLVNESGEALPHAWHTAKGDTRSMLHAVVGSGPGLLYHSTKRIRPGGRSLPRVSVTEIEKGGFEVGQAERKPWTLGGDGSLHFCDLQISLLPLLSSQHPLVWELKHHCDAWADFLGRGRTMHGLDAIVHLRFLSGQSLVACELAVRVLAHESSSLREGLGLRIRSHEARRMRRVKLLPSQQTKAVGHTRISLHHRAEGWFEDSTQLSADPGCVFALEARGHAPLSFNLLGGVAELSCEEEGESVDVLVRHGSDQLRSGEAALFRATIAMTSEAQRPGTALLVPHPSAACRITRLGLELLRGEVDGRAVQAIRERATTWLTRHLPGSPKRAGRHRGDWFFSHSDVGNLEYDTTVGLLQRAFAEIDTPSWEHALAAADHLLTTDWDSLGSGLFFPHGRSHRTASLELGHHWVEGPLLLIEWTNDPLLSQIALAMCQRFEEHLEKCDLDRELPRSLSWSLLAISSISHRWPKRKRARAQVLRLRQHVLERQLPSGLIALSQSERASPFVLGGILLPALTRSLKAIPDRAARKAAKRLAKAVLTHAIAKGDERWFLARQLHWSGRGGRVTRAGSAPGEHAALVCAGLLMAWPDVNRRQAFRGIMRDFRLQLRCDKKKYPGPELSILLRALPSFLARR